MPTWDRTAIPLPWNEIAYYLAGPYDVPEDARSEEGLARFVLRLEDELIDMAARSYAEMGQTPPPKLRKRTAEERAEMLAAAAAQTCEPASEAASATGLLRETTAQSSTIR